VESIVFYILALFLISGAIGIVSLRESIYSAMSFLLVMVAMAGMFALLHQSFLFLAQILVAVGAVVVLSLLIILSINLKAQNLPNENLTPPKVGFFIMIVSPIVLVLLYAINQTNLTFAPIRQDFGSIEVVGQTLFSQWVLPFEVISILLLSAMVGAVVLSRRRLDSES